MTTNCLSLELNELGNEAFQKGDYEAAEKYYTEAINAYPSCTCYTNRSLARAKLGKWETSFEDAVSAIKLDPSHTKAWYRKAQAEERLAKPTNAIDSLCNILEIRLDNNEALRAIYSLLGVQLDRYANGIPPENMDYLVNDHTYSEKLCNWKVGRSINISSGDDNEVRAMELLFATLDYFGDVYRNTRNYVMAMACYYSELYLQRSMMQRPWTFDDWDQLTRIFRQLAEICELLGRLSAMKQFLWKADVLEMNCRGNTLVAEEKYSEALEMLMMAKNKIISSDQDTTACNALVENKTHISAFDEEIYCQTLQYLGHAKRLMGYFREAGIECHVKAIFQLLRNTVTLKGETIEELLQVKLPKSMNACRKTLLAENAFRFGRCCVSTHQPELAKTFIQFAENAFPCDLFKVRAKLEIGHTCVNEARHETSGSKQQIKLLQDADRYLSDGLDIVSRLETYRIVYKCIDELIADTSELCFNLSRARHMMGNFEDAETYIKRAIAAGNDIAQNRDGLASAWTHYGLLLLDLKRYAEAIDAFIKAENFFHAIRDGEGLHGDELILSWDSTAESFIYCNEGHQLALIRNGEILLALEIAEHGRATALQKEYSKRVSTVVQPLTWHEMQQYASEANATLVFYVETHFCNGERWCWTIPPLEKGEIAFRQLTTVRNRECEFCAWSKRCRHQRTTPVSTMPQPMNERKLSVKTAGTLQNINHKELYDEFWPFEPYLPSDPGEKVIILPHGSLNTIHFGALLSPTGKRLIELLTISFAPCIGILVHKQKIRKNMKTSIINRAVIVGDPKIEEDCKRSLKQLPYALQECKIVTELLSVSNAKDVIQITGDKATKGTVVELIKSASIFHIAAHGYVDCEHSRLLTGDLALADGNLSSAEVQELDLSNMKLAFLNCCHSGSGNENNEGLLGLARAFLYAGAGAVVVSHEAVPDSSLICHFVKKFYKKYVEHEDAADALRRACLAMMESRDSSNVWGSFYLFDA